MHSSSSSSPPRDIDIFTTSAELPFAGHPTIGTGCYVLSMASPPASQPRHGTLITKAGPIPVRLDAEGTRAEASIPHNVHIHAATVPCGDVVSLQPGLKRHNLVAPHGFPVVSIVKGMSFVLVELPDEAALAALTATAPPFNVVLDIGWDEGLVGAYYYIKMPRAAAADDDDDDDDDSLSATQQQQQQQRLRTRMLLENLEDPATGSAACTLTCFLALTSTATAAGEGTSGPRRTFDYLITQGVEMGRKSEIGVKVDVAAGGKGVIAKVVLVGGAVMVTRGKTIV